MTAELPAGAEVLRGAGVRLTAARLAVLRALAGQSGSVSPQELYERGRKVYPPLGLVTVYRTLALLDGLGLVRRVHSEQDCHAYAAVGAGHHHLICNCCHRLVEFPCEGLEDLVAAVQARTGFRVTEHLLELTGICPACQAAELSQQASGGGDDAEP